MHDELPIATRTEAQVERRKLMVARDSEVDVAVRQFFRPYVLVFLALAMAVGGNGYGNKLAQYFHHSEVSKASATRMWVDHRDDSSAHGFASANSGRSGFPLLSFSSFSLPRFRASRATTL